MELGVKIKQLRHKTGITQEQLATQLGISAQSVSKWETSVAMPDITLLPLLAETFGVSIDELFDLTKEQKLRRIENRIDYEEEFSGDVFKEYEDFLKTQLLEQEDKTRIKSLLAHLYHHRMQADARKVKYYAREVIMKKPEKKDCQWLLQMAEGDCVWDWNVANHAHTIDFYKEVIKNDTATPKTPLPYYFLLDDLITDHRTQEAKEYLEILQTLPAHKPFLVVIYKAHIALAEYDEKKADSIIETAMDTYSGNSGFLFEVAQYYARKCEYEKAIFYYEKSYGMEEAPRFIDALEGIATIYQILGEKEKAAATYERELENLKTEWKYSDEDWAVQEVERKRARLLS